MALGDGCLRGLGLGRPSFLTAVLAQYTPPAGNAVAGGLNSEVSAPAVDGAGDRCHQTCGVLRGDLWLGDGIDGLRENVA